MSPVVENGIGDITKFKILNHVEITKNNYTNGVAVQKRAMPFFTTG